MAARETLTAFLADCAERAAGPALIYDGREISYAALEEGSRRAAAGLAELGVGTGDRVALWLANAPAWLELYFACTRLGAIAVCVNTRFRGFEVEDIVGRSGAKVLVLWPDFKGIDFAGILSEIDAAKLPQLETVVAYSESRADETIPNVLNKQTVSYNLVSKAPSEAPDKAEPGFGIHIFTTSGTTKAPKFVLHSQAGTVAHARAVARAFGYDAPDAVMLQSLPLCGAFGHAQIMAGLASLRPTVLMRTFEAGPAAALIREYGVTHTNGTDEMFMRMLEARPEPVPFPSLRRAAYASFNSDPMETIRLADSRGLPLVGAYGMSEVQALFSNQDPSAASDVRSRGGGVPASAEAVVRVRDPESGELLGIGVSGELEIKGPSQMIGYFGDPEATAETVTGDGFVRTGDLGYLTDDGFVFQSRMGDVLRLGGYLVNPVEISSFIESLDGIDACQVVGVNPGRGTVPVAFVILKQDARIGEDAIVGHCRKGLARFKVPARVIQVDEFPVTLSANGVKVQRAKLRRMAEEALKA